MSIAHIGRSAGVRDASLTSHGVTQARRLGAGLADTELSWIFASNLQRAVRTAESVRDAQSSTKLDVVQVPDLREKDFGSDEGRRFGAGEMVGDGETRQAMRERATRFLTEHLSPIVVSATDAQETTNIAIVSHGMFLVTLLHTIRSVDYFHSSHIMPLSGDGSLRWHNTGFTRLELSPGKAAVAMRSDAALSQDSAADSINATTAKPPRWPNLRISVATVNNIEHLAGLKKTRGGIGSSQFDAKQKTLTSFFSTSGGPSKKRKAEDQLEK